jgi:serine protease
MAKILAVVWLILIFTITLMSASFTLAAGNDTGPPFKSGEVVVAGAPGSLLAGLEIVKYLPHANITVVKIERGREAATAQRFMTRGRKASLNYIVHAANAPNDQYYSYQWNFTAIQSENAWSLSAGAGVTVAVLDTGVATGGNDGINCIVEPRDVVNADNHPDDGHGHGTHVSGTIAQATGNGIGVAGLAYNACIMPVKVLDDTGTGSFADIAEGIHYAVDHGAGVINMSLGTNARYGLRNDPIMDVELDYAQDQGVTVVCASGNDGWRKNVSYPAIYPTTIAVGATDLNNNVTGYSNKGEGLDIVAPGGDLLKDLNNDGYADGILQETLINGSWGYHFFEGTSMASPHIAAVAAMLMASDSTLTPALVYQAMTTTALDLNDIGYDATSGYGLIQAYDALVLTSVDVDGDGMPDSWELSHGLDPGNPVDAYNDADDDGLTNLDEYNAGSDPHNPDTDNDGFLDGFDGYPLDNQQSSCPPPIQNASTLKSFPTVQAAVDDANAADYDTIQMTAADYREDVLYDRNALLILAGGYYCSYADNPSTSSIKSLTIRNGSIIVENLVLY